MEKINFDVIFKTNLKEIEKAIKELRNSLKQLQNFFIQIDLKPVKNISKKLKESIETKNIKDIVKELQKEVEEEQAKELLKRKEKERKEISRITRELQKEIERDQKEQLKREKELQKQRERQEKEFQKSIERSRRELADKLSKPLRFESRLIPKELQLKALLPAFNLLPNQFKNTLNALYNDLTKNFNDVLEKTKRDIENKLSKPLVGSKLIPKSLLINTLIPTYSILPDQIKMVLKPIENLATGFKKAGAEKDKFRDNVKTLSPTFSELEKRARKSLDSIKRDFRDLSFELGMLAFHLFILFSEFSNILRGFENFANTVLEVGGEVQLLERRLQSLFRASSVGMAYVNKSLSDFIALSIRTPVTLRDIIDSFTQMKAVGLDSVDVLKLTIDTAVAFGKDVSQIADDIARAIEGDAVAYKNLRHSIGLTNIKLKEFGGVVDSSGRLFLRNSEAVEKNAQALIKYITQFKGTAENTLGTIPQLLSNIEDAFVSLNKQVLDSNESLKNFLTFLQGILVDLAQSRGFWNTVVVGFMEFATNLGVLQKGITPLNNSIGTLIMNLTSLTTAISTTLFTTNELVAAPDRLRQRIQQLDREIALLGNSNRELRETLTQQRQELEKMFNSVNRYLPSLSKTFNSFISTLDKFFLPIIFFTQRLLSVIFWVNFLVLALSALMAIWDSTTRGFREGQKTMEQISDSFKQLGDLVRDADKMGFTSFREEVDKNNKILDEFNSKLKEVESGKEIQVFLEVIQDKKTADLLDFLVKTKVKSFNIKINEDVLDTLKSFKQNVEGIVDATNRLNEDIKIKVDTTGIDELSNKLKNFNKNLNEIDSKELIDMIKNTELVKIEFEDIDKYVDRIMRNFRGYNEATLIALRNSFLDIQNINKMSLEDLEKYRDYLEEISIKIGKQGNSDLPVLLRRLNNLIGLKKYELNLQKQLIESIELSIRRQKDFNNLILEITKARIRDTLVDVFKDLNKNQENIKNTLLNYIFLENNLTVLEKQRIEILGKIEEKQRRIKEIQEQLPKATSDFEKIQLNTELLGLQNSIVELSVKKNRIDKEYTKNLEMINNLSNSFVEQLQDIISLEYEGVDVFNLQAKEVEKFRKDISLVLDDLVRMGKLTNEQAKEIKNNISIFSERLQLQEREKNTYDYLNNSLKYVNSIEEIRNQVLVMRNFLLNEITKKEKYLGDLSKEKLEVIKKTSQIEKEAIDKLLEDRINFGNQEIENLEQLKNAYYKAREDIDSVFRGRRFELIKLKIEGKLDEKSFRENLDLLEKQEKEKLSSLNKNLYNELVNLVNSIDTKNLDEAFRLLDEISKFSFNLPINQMEKLNQLISKQRVELIRNNNTYQALYNMITELYRKGLDISELNITFIDPKILKQLKKDLEEFKKEFADEEKIEEIGKAYDSLFERIRDKVIEFSSVREVDEFLSKIEKMGIKLREAFKKDVIKNFFKESIDRITENIKKIDELKNKISSGLKIGNVKDINELQQNTKEIVDAIKETMAQVTDISTKLRLSNLLSKFSSVGIEESKLGKISLIEESFSLEEALQPFKKAQLEAAKFSVGNLAKQAQAEIESIRMDLERQRQEMEREALQAELQQVNYLKNIDGNIGKLVDLLTGEKRENTNTTTYNLPIINNTGGYFQGFIKR
jgi:DNA repair exonuclease SbcCD ATPase subunit